MLERAARGAVRADAEVVFVDEAQDLSPLQWAVIEKLVRRSHEVHIAGDDDQAIYTWAGADVHGMARFTDKHKGDSHVLSYSHRLPASVHARSQELIRRVAFRVDKEFSPKADLGLVRVHGSINSVEIVHGEDILLLGRTHSVLREVEQSLIERRIPYTRESGRPGLYQNRYASGIRAFRKLGRGERVTEGERNAIFTISSAETRRLLEAGDHAALGRTPFYVALQIPGRVVDFYTDADLDTEPTIRLSTIHAAKGHEADRVILLTDMTTRVQQTAEKSPDDEVRVFYVGMTRSKRVLDIVEGYNGYRL
jgi:DNA helicase-2/ATP-dependent DNA helicase PcrA